ncbi:hypothetical protein OH76DRAFT_1359738 [Lentinus brumalis]|uniref:Uncharacterized protein n=1 Tax=Lentinus brumalis TaxID=2498619 RepID=A0A371CVR2_9APHY|nr:hypothetical protein OH76DRAFT_1359738 [Polyporus brumalis]
MGVLIPGCRPDDITLACVFCPCIGFNMPSNLKEVTPKNKLFLYGPVYGGDSNHGASKRARKDNKNDRRLAPGYWVDHPRQVVHLVCCAALTHDLLSYPQDQTCSGFKVGRSQRTGKFRFVEISGIVAITCRHIFFRSGAVIDLIMGKRYSFTNFALAGAMRGDEELPEHHWSYDVLCIYIKQMLERWGVYFPKLVPIIAKMFCCIPLFHIHSHRDLCQAVFSMCYAIGWGLLHMETVEHPWARLNKAAAPLREMTGGACHDAYNDLFNFWNREKLERMGECL